MEKATSYASKEKSTKMRFQFLTSFAPNTRAPIFVKETLLKFKSLFDPHTMIVGNFSIPLSLMDRPSSQKLNQEVLGLTHFKPNGQNISIDHFTQTQKNIHSLQNLTELFPKSTMYVVTKQVSTYIN